MQEKQNSGSVQSFFIQSVRIGYISVVAFIKNKGFDTASTLTFYTLMTIVPLLAIGFGVAQFFGFTDQFAEQVKEQFKSQPEITEKLIEFSNSTLKTTRGGIIASFGFILLFWSVLRTISNIELFFNQIWHVLQSRSFLQQAKDYTPFILLFPIFLVGSNSVILTMSNFALSTTKMVGFLSFLSPLIVYGFQLISYFVSWSLLSLLYIYLPYTKVSWKAGFIAGMITGIIFFIWQWIYVSFQVKASSYGAVYGSFAAIPLFLVWLNYSWLILIFGAEISYNIEHSSKN